MFLFPFLLLFRQVSHVKLTLQNMILMMTGSIGNIIAVLASCFVLWYIISVATSWYRLRHIPGPFLAAFSYLWIAPVSFHVKHYETNKVLNEKFGPLVRVGPNELTTDDPDVLRRINGVKSTYAKGNWYNGIRFNPYHPTMFTLLDIEGHDKMKAKLSPGYSGRETPGIEDDIDDQLKSLIGMIRRKYVTASRGGEFRPLDLARVSGYFTLDVISRVALGKEFGSITTDTDPHDFYHSVDRHIPLMTLISNVPWIRNIMYSSTGLKLLGPRETDTAGLGKIMG